MYPRNLFAIFFFLLPFTQLKALTDHEVVSTWWSKSSLERRDEAQAGTVLLDLFAKAQSERQKSNVIDWEYVHAAEACNLITPPAGSTVSILHNIKVKSGLGLASELYLAKAFLHPESDIKKLQKKQAIIVSLYSDDTILEACKSVKQNYGTTPEKALSLHTIKQDKITKHCFSDRSLNWFGKKNGLFIPSFLDGALYNGYMALQSALTISLIIKNIYNAPSELMKYTIQYANAPLRRHWNYMVAGGNIGGNFATLLTIALRYDILLKKMYEYRDLKAISNELYQSYHTALEGAYAIRDLSQQYPVLANMETLINIDFFEQAVKADKDLKRCVKLIQAGPGKLWAYEQQTLITLLQEHKNSFAGIFELIAEFETYIALAELKHHFDTQKVHLCFATFNENERPYLSMTGFWNPLLDETRAIPNSLSFGGDNRHMILTGSNTGGKSTLMRACIANSMLAQTFGIAFADAITLTPFEQILASFNIVDNTATEDSRFVSEIKRAKLIRDTVQSGRKSFVVCDELFTGAAAANAGRAVAEILKQIAQAPHSISLFATHHGEVVTNLGAHRPFFNMKIDASKISDGSIKHTYQCVPGISTENIANDLLRIHLGI